MTDKLSIYNGALTVLGERRLANLNENREPRLKLDDVWDNDFLDRILKMGQWKFAIRSYEASPTPEITTPFGEQFAFQLTPDHLRTTGVAYDEYFEIPITRYKTEGKVLYCDTDRIYIAYVSNDSQFGGNFELWPPNFTEMAEHYLAWKTAPTIGGLDISDKKLGSQWKAWLAEAKATDAMEQPAKFPPKGAWANSRQGFRRGNQERGSRRQLIG